MKSLLLHKRTERGIRILTLNRPEVMNCINFALLRALAEAIAEVDDDTGLRCLVLAGAASRDPGRIAFSSGVDLKERRTMSAEQVRRFIVTLQRTFAAVERTRVPVIAALDGFVLGGGLELALACDIRLATARAVLGLPETGLAILPGGGGTQRLPRLVGIAHAKELILTAGRIGVDTALAIGLVNRVAEPGRLMEAALELAGEIAQNGPIGVAQAKWAIDCGVEMPLDVALSLESKACEITLPTRDRSEALRAFAERRTPVFRGV